MRGIHLGLLTGCLLFSAAAAELPVLTEKDSGSVCRLKAGESRRIRLIENPTTGYGWKFFIPADGSVQCVSSRYQAPDRRLCGAPGMRELVIRAVRPGRSGFLGYYYRSWEGLHPERDQHFRLTLEIVPAVEKP